MDERRRTVVATGLQTRHELLAEGSSDREIRAAVRSGQLVRVSHGVYGRPSFGTGELVYPQNSRDFQRQQLEQRRLIFAAALRGADPLVSHSSAAALYGLPLVSIGLSVVHLIGPRSDGGQRRGAVFRHPGGQDVATIRIDGVRVTAPARTLVDLARSESFVCATTAIDAALHRNLVQIVDLEAELNAASGRVRIHQARRAVAFADARSESPGESMTRVALQELGFPPPDLQVTVWDASGTFVGRVDLGYPELGVLIEFDGLQKYGAIPDGPDARAALIDEKRREDRLRAAGFVVLRLTWSDVRDRDLLQRLVSAAIATGSRSVAAGLVTGTARAA